MGRPGDGGWRRKVGEKEEEEDLGGRGSIYRCLGFGKKAPILQKGHCLLSLNNQHAHVLLYLPLLSVQTSPGLNGGL